MQLSYWASNLSQLEMKREEEESRKETALMCFKMKLHLSKVNKNRIFLLSRRKVFLFFTKDAIIRSGIDTKHHRRLETDIVYYRKNGQGGHPLASANVSNAQERNSWERKRERETYNFCNAFEWKRTVYACVCVCGHVTSNSKRSNESRMNHGRMVMSKRCKLLKAEEKGTLLEEWWREGW